MVYTAEEEVSITIATEVGRGLVNGFIGWSNGVLNTGRWVSMEVRRDSKGECQNSKNIYTEKREAWLLLMWAKKNLACVSWLALMSFSCEDTHSGHALQWEEVQQTYTHKLCATFYGHFQSNKWNFQWICASVASNGTAYENYSIKREINYLSSFINIMLNYFQKKHKGYWCPSCRRRQIIA